MATGINQHLAVFRTRIRKLQDKGNPSNHELLGLFFDLYEIFMVMSEDIHQDLAESILGTQLMKVDKDTFDKVVERDKEASAKKTAPKVSKGQYL